MRATRLLFVIVFLPITTSASFVTFYDTHLIVDPGGLIILQNPQGSDWTGYGFEVTGASLYTWGSFADEGCTVSIQSLDGTSSTTLPQSSRETFEIGYGLFYFDVSTYGYHPPDKHYTASGSALMENSPTSGLVMIQSEVTYELVPEPSTALLLLTGYCACWCFQRRSSMNRIKIRTSASTRFTRTS